jgi:hypothetical protein
MKTLAKLAVLFPLVAACGGVTSANFRETETQCSLALRANSTAVEVQQAVNDVLEGRMDPCGGAISDLRSRNVSLERIDAGRDTDNQSVFTLVFRVSGNEHGAYQPK